MREPDSTDRVAWSSRWSERERRPLSLSHEQTTTGLQASATSGVTGVAERSRSFRGLVEGVGPLTVACRAEDARSRTRTECTQV